jgi:2-C-methyl-D-erythritol 4-phosphate cytidylyltransferase
MKTQVVVPVAGSGVRMNQSTPKPLLLLNGKPLFLYALNTFERCALVDSVIVVAHPDYMTEYKTWIRREGLKKVAELVPGGATRRESVYAGLQELDADTDIVVVHDGARPLVTRDIIEESIRLCKNFEAVVAAVAVKSTIKRVSGKDLIVQETLNRKELWEIQTPQTFRAKKLLNAHAQLPAAEDFTDDAAMVEAMGGKVKILQGLYSNIKITTPEDLVIAQALLAR